MEEYVIKKVLENELSEKEIKIINNNKELICISYLSGMIDNMIYKNGD